MPIRPENRHRYPADWRAIRETILQRARVGGLFSYEGLLPRCECLGECGRGTHAGRCPNVNGCPAYGTGSRVVLTVAHLCHLHYDRGHHAQTRARTIREARESAGQTTFPAMTPRDRKP